MNAERSIHIVDDDEGHAHLIAYNLREAGVQSEILWFQGGHAFLEYIADLEDANAKPMVVLLDLNMPGMSGQQVLQTLRASTRTSTLPVIVLTSSSERADIDDCYRMGCNLYLPKPVAYDRFAHCIQQLGLTLEIAEFPVPSEPQTVETSPPAAPGSKVVRF